MKRSHPLLFVLLVGVALAGAPAGAQEGPDFTYERDLEEGSQPVYEVVPTYNVLVATRVGDEVAADVYLPGRDGDALPGPWPTILHYTPYDKQSRPTPAVHADAQFFTVRGYAVVVADTPGEGNSSGSQPDGILTQRITQAGYDVVEWIADQPWSDGNVGMHGLSFPGFLANRVAAAGPPHLKAVFSSQSDSDYYLDVAWPGGLLAFNNQLGFGGFYATDQTEPPNTVDGEDPNRFASIYFQRLTQTRNLFLEVSNHPEDGPWWEERSPDEGWPNVRASVYQYGGWRDLFLRGNVRNFLGMRPSAPARRNLVIGPWTHGASTGISYRGLQLRFFDAELKGRDNGFRDDGPVRLFLTGTGEWRDYPTWPVPGTTPTRWYLRAEASGSAQSLNDGSLSLEPPAGPEPADTIAYEPATAGYGEGGELFEGAVPPADQRAEEAKKLTWTTPPFASDTTVVGSSWLRLWASSTAPETQFSVKVTDVDPSGTSTLLKEGWLNATHRRSHVRAEALERGTPYEFEVEVWPIGHVFRAGHRLRVDVALSDFPRVLGSRLPSTVSVLHDAEHPSFLEVPVVAPDRVRRHRGADRTETAAAVADRQFANAARTVVLARADDYADALAAAPLAAKLHAPLLLTDGAALSASAGRAIFRVQPNEAVIVGGEGAVSPAVERELVERGLRVRRIAGSNRFATAARILTDAFPDAREVLVAEGAHGDPRRGWPDALSASGYGAALGVPVLLATRDGLPDETAAVVHAGADVTIVGGTGAVGRAVATRLDRLGGDVRRLSGPTREATSVAVAAAAEARGADPAVTWVASAENFPDGLVAGAAAGDAGGILLLVDGEDGPSDATLQWLAARSERIGALLLAGGETSITPAAEERLRAALG